MKLSRGSEKRKYDMLRVCYNQIIVNMRDNYINVIISVKI